MIEFELPWYILRIDTGNINYISKDDDQKGNDK